VERGGLRQRGLLLTPCEAERKAIAMKENITPQPIQQDDLLIIELDDRLEFSTTLVDSDIEADNNGAGCLNGSGCVSSADGAGCINSSSCC
jgi:hypothetical protein